MRVAIVPGKAQLPQRGGVREHMLQLYRQLDKRFDIELVGYAAANVADVVHVESAYKSPVGRSPDVYVCHGGFLPKTIPSVIDNLNTASVIVSVSQWIADEFFSDYADRTVVIHNGVDLQEWENPVPYNMDGYILYAKDYVYHMDDFVWLANAYPDTRFVSVMWPNNVPVPRNVRVVGLQTKANVASLLANATCLMLPGPEVCPTMLLEAWACGTPVLAKDTAGCAELMRYNSPLDIHGNRMVHGGMLYKDRGDLAHAASLIYARRADMAKQAKWKVRQYFQVGDLFEKYIEIYNAVCSGRISEYLSTHSLESKRPT